MNSSSPPWWWADVDLSLSQALNGFGAVLNAVEQALASPADLGSSSVKAQTAAWSALAGSIFAAQERLAAVLRLTASRRRDAASSSLAAPVRKNETALIQRRAADLSNRLHRRMEQIDCELRRRHGRPPVVRTSPGPLQIDLCV